MTRDGDEDESGFDDDQELGPDEADRIDEPATIQCRYCSRDISEEAEQCPHCGMYQVPSDLPRRHAWWWIAAVILLAALVLHYVFRW